MRGKLLLTLVLLSPVWASAQKGFPLFTGVVTSVAPSGSFEINTGVVKLQPGATFSRRTGKATVPLTALYPPFLGEAFDCYCTLDEKSNTLHVTHLTEIAPGPRSITSRGIVEAVVSGSGSAPVVRADGYLLHLPRPPALAFEDGLSLDMLAPNEWISYKGTLNPDGSVDVTEADLWRNAPEGDEARLRDHEDFNPDVVDPANTQSGLSKAMFGVDPKKLPPHVDPVLQARLDKVGNALVPGFQRSLDVRDPSKIPFRFHAVDAGKLRDPIALTSGIVLVPYAAIERLPQDSDDQLAALLADSIAVVLEKQKFLNKSKHATLRTASILSAAASAAPVGVLAIPLTAGGSIGAGANRRLYTTEMQQSGRVSLWLLHDAGYDVKQAPLAWWQLSSAKAKPLAQIELPPRTLDLYEQLGTTWRAPVTEPPNSSVPAPPDLHPSS